MFTRCSEGRQKSDECNAPLFSFIYKVIEHDLISFLVTLCFFSRKNFLKIFN